MEDGQLAQIGKLYRGFSRVFHAELALELFSHLESSTELRTKFRTFLDKWTEFLASDAGKGSYNIQACADIGTFRGPRGTWRQYMSGTLF